MFSNSSQKPSKGTGKSRANNKHVWYHPTYQQKLNYRPEDSTGFIHFDSEMEFSVYLTFSPKDRSEMQIHHPVELIPKPNQILWKVDYYFPMIKRIVEVKGEWINSSASSASKSLLIHQIKLAKHAGYRVVLLGDVDFKVGPYNALNYRKWRLTDAYSV